MKKTILAIIVIMTCALTAQAQENVLGKGTTIANIGVAYGNNLHDINIPPIALSFEHGVAEFGRPGGIGVGAFVNFFAYSGNSYNYMQTPIGVRAAYHFTIVDNWEVFAGTGMGASIESWNRNTDVYYFHNEFIGTRFMFSHGFGAYVEAGVSNSYGYNGAIGVTFRF